MARDGAAVLTAEGAAPGAVPSSRRHRRTAVIAAIVLLAMIVSGAVGYWRWSVGASDLISYSSINQDAPVPVGQPTYVGADIQPKSPRSGHRRLEIRRIPHTSR